MKTSAVVKIILIIFFVIFFVFLFYYFYDPSGTKDVKDKQEDSTSNASILSALPFNKIKNAFFGDKTPTKVDDRKIKELEKQKEDELVFKMPTLRQLTNVPTAGLIIEPLSKTEIFDINKDFDKDKKLKEDEKYWEIRYILTKNNHVYRKYNFSLKQERIANVTIPKIRSVHFFDKDNYIIRYLNDKNILKTYSVQLTDKEPTELQKNTLEEGQKLVLKDFRGIFFPDNILNLTLNKQTKQVFYLKDNYVGSVGFISDSKNSGVKQVFKSPLKEWNFYWPNKNKILFTTMPAYNTETLSFVLDLKNKNYFSKINYPIMAGNALPDSDFSKILYSGYKNKHFRLISIEGKERKTHLFALRTFTDKCVWSRDNIYAYCAEPSYVGDFQPDNWYKGKKYFSDKIVVLDTDSGEIIELFNPKDDKEVFDIVDMALDPEERYLYFKDKKTDFYWSLDLQQVAEEKAKAIEDKQKLVDNLYGQ